MFVFSECETVLLIYFIKSMPTEKHRDASLSLMQAKMLAVFGPVWLCVRLINVMNALLNITQYIYNLWYIVCIFSYIRNFTYVIINVRK